MKTGENKLKYITMPRNTHSGGNYKTRPLLELSIPEFFEKKEIFVPIITIKQSLSDKPKSELSPEEEKLQEELKEVEQARKSFENQYKTTIQLIELQKQDIFKREQQLQFKVSAANMQLKTYCDKYNEEKRKLKEELSIIKAENQKLKEDNEKYLNIINKIGLSDQNTFTNASNSYILSTAKQSFRINYSSKNLPNVSLNGKKIDFKELSNSSNQNLKKSTLEEKELSPPVKEKAVISTSISISSPKSMPVFDIQRPPKPSEIKALVVGPKIEQKPKVNDTQQNLSNHSSGSQKSSSNSSGSSNREKRSKKKVIASPQILDDSNSSVFDEFDDH